MDRTLVAETPPLQITANRVVQQWDLDLPSEWRVIGGGQNLVWLHESTLDLGGYTRQDDLTVFFRSSFEQKGGEYSASFAATEQSPLSGFDATIQEVVLVSSVPMNDDNLFGTFAVAPGFTVVQNGLFPFDFGTFNRTHIIHGRKIVHGPSLVLGSSELKPTPPADGGEGYWLPVDISDFSSLEPTAADTLYVYRILLMPRPSIQDSTGLNNAFIPARRIILDTVVDEESELSYMMRLKRSYELANQV